MAIVKVSYGDDGTVCEREGALVRNGAPVSSCDEGRDGTEVGVCFGGHGVVELEMFLGEVFASSAEELEGQGDEEEFGVNGAGFLEDGDGLLGITAEECAGSHHGVDGCGILGICFAVHAVGVVSLRVAPATDFEAELAMERLFGGHGVKFGEAALFAELADDSFPLSRFREGCAWSEAGHGVFAYVS